MINNWLKYTWKRVRRIQFFYTIISKYSHNNVYACCPIFYQEIKRFKLQYQSKYTNYKINYVIYKPSIHPGSKQSSRGAHCNPRASRKIIIAKSQWLITPYQPYQASSAKRFIYSNLHQSISARTTVLDNDSTRDPTKRGY